ncbi:MAG: tetratricopeptide repeat protein [Ardenticatenales bacterium]|nr:tetratricopeptide repeat protein [Ardenticatenales bacterium]
MLKNHLRLLIRAGLIRESAPAPASDYLFRHELMQDVAYHSLLREDRVRLHHAVGESLEQIYAGQLEEFASLLAHHFYEANAKEQAFKYYALAAAQDARSYASEEAIFHYNRALALIPDEGVEAGVLLDLYLGRGRVLEVCGRYEEALAGYRELLALANARGNSAMELAALMAAATLLSTPNPVYNPEEGEATLKRALQIATILGKREAEAQILWTLLLLVQYSAGDPERAIAYGEQALQIARTLHLRGRLAYILNDLPSPYWITGRLEEARAAQREAGQLWEEFGNIPMWVDNLEGRARFCFTCGEYDEAIRLTEQALSLSRSIDHKWGQVQSRFFVGHVYIDTGRLGEAISLMEEAAQLAEEAGHTPVRLAVTTDLGWLYGTLGAVEEGLTLAARALEWARPRFGYLQSWPLSIMARLYLLQGNLAEAERALAESKQSYTSNLDLVLIPVSHMLAVGEVALAAHRHDEALAASDDLLAYLRKTHTRVFVPDAFLLRAQTLLVQRQEDGARPALEEALAHAETLGSRRILWRILALLGELEEQQGNHEAAHARRQAAREHITYIVEQIHLPTLRQTFLTSPPVRTLFADS